MADNKAIMLWIFIAIQSLIRTRMSVYEVVTELRAVTDYGPHAIESIIGANGEQADQCGPPKSRSRCPKTGVVNFDGAYNGELHPIHVSNRSSYIRRPFRNPMYSETGLRDTDRQTTAATAGCSDCAENAPKRRV